MNQPYRNLAFSLIIALGSFLFAAGCTPKAEESAEPVETKKSVRVAGVMSGEGANIPEDELALIYDAVKQNLDAAGLKGEKTQFAIEVFILKTPQSGGGQGILKVHSEASKEVVAETLLEFNSVEELAAKVTDYLKEV